MLDILLKRYTDVVGIHSSDKSISDPSADDADNVGSNDEFDENDI